MPKFVVAKADEELPYVVSLHEEAYGVSVRLSRGQSEVIRVLEFNNNGHVNVRVDRIIKFNLFANVLGGKEYRP